MPTNKVAHTHSRLFVRNSVASLVRAASSSSLAVLVPLFLARLLSSADYSAWVLAMGIASYVLNFDLGLQSSIQSIVARFSGNGDHVAASKAGINSVRIAFTVGLLAFAAIVFIGITAPFIFVNMGQGSINTFRGVLLLLGIGQISALTSNVMSAYYMGYREGSTPTLFIGGSRIATLLCIVGAASARFGVIQVALAFCIPQVVGTVALFLRLNSQIRYRRITSDHPSTRTGIRSVRILSILKYSAPLAVWAICMLLVNGSGVTIVGIFAYSALPAYSIAVMLAQIIVGLQAAVAAPLLAELSRRSGSGESISALTEFACRVNSIFVLGLCASLSAVVPVLKLWLPPSVTSHLTPIVAVLLIFAFGIRLLSSPLSTHIVASDGHSRVVLPPIIEAILNVGLAYLFGYFWGILGVTLGILTSSLLGTVLTYRISIRLAGLNDLIAVISFRRLVASPLAICLPFGVASCLVGNATNNATLEALFMLFLAAITIAGLAVFHHGKSALRPTRLIKRLFGV